MDEVEDALHAGVVRAAEVDPGAQTPDVGVAPRGRDLLAGHEQQVVGPHRDLLEVGGRVVVGDREEVEADAAGLHDVLIDGVVPVAVDSVGVKVALVPTPLPVAGMRLHLYRRE